MENVKEFYSNLLPWEKVEFCKWLLDRGELKDIIEEVLNDKYEEWRCKTIEDIVEII